MAKISLDSLMSGYRSIQKFNANFDAIETAFENTLSRDGTTPNQLEASLDLNGNRIINLAAPVYGSDVVRLQDLATGTGAYQRAFMADVRDYGAVGDGSADDTAAFQAALLASRDVYVPIGTYRLTAPLVMSSDASRLRGAGRGAAILLNDHSSDTIQIGSAAYPTRTHIHDIAIIRSTAPANPSGAAKTGQAAIRVQGAVRGLVERVYIAEHYIGIFFNDTGGFKVCESLITRSLGTGASNAYGIYINGEDPSGLGYPTSNASLRLENVDVGMSTSLGTTYGAFAKGAISDLFLHDFETGGCSYGQWLEGDSGVNTTIDIHLSNVINDGIRTTGIYVTGMATHGAVSILGGYCSLGASGGRCIDLYQAAGVSIVGHQFINNLGGSGIGCYIRSSKHITLTDFTSKNCTFAVAMESSSFTNVSGSVFLSQTFSSVGYGASMTGGSNNEVKLFLSSDAGTAKFTDGISVDSTASANTFYISGIRLTSVGTKLRINGTAMTATGLVGTNFIVGSYS